MFFTKAEAYEKLGKHVRCVFYRFLVGFCDDRRKGPLFEDFIYLACEFGDLDLEFGDDGCVISIILRRSVC